MRYEPALGGGAADAASAAAAAAAAARAAEASSAVVSASGGLLSGSRGRGADLGGWKTIHGPGACRAVPSLRALAGAALVAGGALTLSQVGPAMEAAAAGQSRHLGAAAAAWATSNLDTILALTDSKCGGGWDDARRHALARGAAQVEAGGWIGERGRARLRQSRAARQRAREAAAEARAAAVAAGALAEDEAARRCQLLFTWPEEADIARAAAAAAAATSAADAAAGSSGAGGAAASSAEAAAEGAISIAGYVSGGWRADEQAVSDAASLTATASGKSAPGGKHPGMASPQAAEGAASKPRKGKRSRGKTTDRAAGRATGRAAGSQANAPPADAPSDASGAAAQSAWERSGDGSTAEDVVRQWLASARQGWALSGAAPLTMEAAGLARAGDPLEAPAGAARPAAEPASAPVEVSEAAAVAAAAVICRRLGSAVRRLDDATGICLRCVEATMAAAARMGGFMASTGGGRVALRGLDRQQMRQVRGRASLCREVGRWGALLELCAAALRPSMGRVAAAAAAAEGVSAEQRATVARGAAAGASLARRLDAGGLGRGAFPAAPGAAAGAGAATADG